jgi:hypothetical protein
MYNNETVKKIDDADKSEVGGLFHYRSLMAKTAHPARTFIQAFGFPGHVAASSRYVVVQLNTPRNVYVVTRYDTYHSFKFPDIRGSAAARSGRVQRYEPIMTSHQHPIKMSLSDTPYSQ